VVCPTNCMTCNSQGTCSACVNSFYVLNTGNNTCTGSCNITGCLTCGINGTTCQVCNSQSTNVNNFCVNC
jgi:hypothetical protein